jgi:hypothetical protein
MRRPETEEPLVNNSDSYTATKLIEKLQAVEWAGTTYELPVWLYEAILEHLRSSGPESEAVKLLRRCHDAGDLVTPLDETLWEDVEAFLGGKDG